MAGAAGAAFESVDFAGAVFESVDFAGAAFASFAGAAFASFAGAAGAVSANEIIGVPRVPTTRAALSRVFMGFILMRVVGSKSEKG